MTLSVVIADDEVAARARLRRFLADEHDVEVVAECEDGRAAAAAILSRKPDVVFLDGQLPELTELGVLETVPRESVPQIVIVDAAGARAADVGEAFDHLSDPFDATSVRQTLARAQARLSDRGDRAAIVDAIRQIVRARGDVEVPVAQANGSADGHAVPAALDQIPVKSDGRVMLLNTADVDFIESAANYVKLHVGERQYSLREKIGALADRLDRKQFARIHRTTIVNLARIQEVQPWFSGDAIVILRDGKKLRLSRMYRRTLAPVFGRAGLTPATAGESL